MTSSRADTDHDTPPQPEITTEQVTIWLEEMQRERAAKRAEAPTIAERLKRQLFPELLRMHLAEAIITYDGWADDGSLETIALRWTEGTVVPDDHPIWEEPCTGCEGVHGFKRISVREALEDIAWWLIETFYPGFENNDGGRGEIVLDFWGKSIRIEHDVRFYAYDRHSEEL